ncbi:hypothetical protein AB7C87_06050 [Natrarchaeobius sp. A-rgal3]|uniref:hypothetical protein n=1 Tax=Natrarchaeobius versutus TaxID=1679078 RepID=UPI00351077C3
MNHSRATISLAVVLVIALGAGAAVATVVAAQSNVQVSSVTVSPEEPTTGEQVTLETEIANLESSSGPVDVTDVYVRTDGSAETHGRVDDVGSIGPGGSVTVPLTTSFDRPGTKTLTVHVVVEDDSETRRTYQYPVSVDVADPTIRADLSIGSSINQSGTTQVELTNYGNVELTDVEVTASVDGEVVDRRPSHDVDPESSRTVRFDTNDLADEEVTFTASYAAAGDDHETVTTRMMDQPVEGEVLLTGVETTRTAGGVTIRGDAANVGNTDTESVLVRIPDEGDVSPGSSGGDYFIGSIDASEFATFELTAALESNASTVPVEIAYIVDDERVTTVQEVGVDSGQAAATGERAQTSEPRADGGGSSGLFGFVGLFGIGLVVAVVAVGGGLYYVWNRE